MGNCNSEQAIQPRQDSPIVISPEARSKAQLLFNKSKVCKYLAEMLDGSSNGLDGIAYTENQANDLAKALIEGIMKLGTQQQMKDKLGAADLLGQEDIELIKNQRLHYYGVLSKINKNDKQIHQSIKSRIYHTIANLKKQKPIQQKWKNAFGINCIKSNSYKLLSEIQVNEVIKYETISDHVLRMGDKIGFKLKSIKEQSSQIHEIITKTMVKHNQRINKLSYQLSKDEVMQMAAISREACDHHDNGIFLLLVYFVQSAKLLENLGKTPQEIQSMLNDAIQSISKKYPPGEGLSKQNESLITTLKQLEFLEQSQFYHQQTTLGPTNKQAQVEQIIRNYATVAQQCKDLFEDLIKSTCLQRSVYYKIGLKYYPKKPNKKALTRIKQKMFFGKYQTSLKIMKGSIKEILVTQQNDYRSIVDKLLQNSTAVSFKISDMVRGKCVFLEISDIIQAVKSIKDYVSKDNRFKMQEIESRFTNTTPISDVTLKIAINNKIVAELQLTIQNNAATYNFAHKIYELQRTKLFSKLKIVHNYFQQFNGDFNQLISKALSLLISKQTISQQNITYIKKYFNLKSISTKSFFDSLSEAIEPSKNKIVDFGMAVDSQLQQFMFALFGMATGLWYKQLGKIINTVIKDQKYTPKLKSVLLSCFFDKFDLPKESQYMHQLGIQQEQLKQKIFTQQFISEYFQIEKAFRYSNENQRLFHRVEQLKQIKFSMDQQTKPIKLRNSQFVMNCVIEQDCFQNISRIKDMLDFYFVTRREKQDTIYDEFSFYYKWLEKYLKGEKYFDKEKLMRAQISLIKAQQLLEKNKPLQASQLLEYAKKIFKSIQKQEKVIDCDILITECFIKTSNTALKDSINKYNQVIVKKAETLGLQLKGPLYTDAMWRISEFFWNNTKEDEKKELLQSFTTIAIRQMSRSKGKHFIYALIKRWKQFQLRGVKQCQILANDKIQYVKLYHLRIAGAPYLTIAKWDNLIKLNLGSNFIGAKGCEHLVKNKWSKLAHLNLDDNDIGDSGCEHLSKCGWQNLTHLYLWGNNIGAGGCQHISTAKWQKLTLLHLWGNNIQANGCEHLSKAKWTNLSQLNLWSCNIGTNGCQFLSKAKWENLTHLNLNDNSIASKGCDFLAKSNWQNLRQLNLRSNNIEASGCAYLIQAKWPQIHRLNLDDNQIGDIGSKYLATAKWEQLRYLNICRNKFEGDRKLLRAEFSQQFLIITWY